MTEHMFGGLAWSGVYDGAPAIALSYYGGAALWVFDDGWKQVAQGATPRALFEAAGISPDEKERKP